jgi:signal transduction histidine kinase
MDDQEKSRGQLVSLVDAMQQKIQELETRQRQCEKALHDSQQQLQQAQKMETLGTLVAGVAHEINNPINLIMYNIPLLQKIWSDFMPVLKERQQQTPDQKFGGFDYAFLADNLVQLLSDMQMAAHRVAKTVLDLKNFSRQSNVAEKTPLQLNNAVNNALRLAQTTLRASSVAIDVQLGENLPDIEGNLQSIEQIILNIIVNAIQAIDHDRGRIEITTGYRNQDGKAYIRIADNGRGISPAISDKIFLPFVLSVSYSLVKAHEGEIFFETTPGQGTAFTVHLPSVLKGQAPKILVVDDDNAIRQMLIEALTMDRLYLVEEAANGIEASIKLGTYRPDLLILDIFMPEMDGLEVCRTISNEPELSAMKVIITTGYPEHPKLDEVVALGYTNIFSKPFDLLNFIEAIDKILGGQ